MTTLSNAELVAVITDNVIARYTKYKYSKKVDHCVEYFKRNKPEYYSLDSGLNWEEICTTVEGTEACYDSSKSMTINTMKLLRSLNSTKLRL